MLIYQAPSDRFIDDVRGNTISDIMSENYKARLGKDPGIPEFVSWQNSLSRVRDLLELGKIHDTFVALEYEVPYNQSRLHPTKKLLENVHRIIKNDVVFSLETDRNTF